MTTRSIILALVGILATASLGAYCGHSSESAELRTLRASADSLSLASSSAAQAGERDRARADSLLAVVERSTAERDSLRLVAASKRVRYEREAAAAPDTCKTVILAADSALAASDSARKSVEIALQQAQDAAETLRQGYDSTATALGLLRASESKLRAALDASQPTLRDRLTPHVIVGPAVGVDAAGLPHLVFAVGLGWRF